jgi:hypothetical protein
VREPGVRALGFFEGFCGDAQVSRPYVRTPTPMGPKVDVFLFVWRCSATAKTDAVVWRRQGRPLRGSGRSPQAPLSNSVPGRGEIRSAWRK